MTEKGRNYVEDHQDMKLDQKGRGGVVHRYWQHHIKELFETAGWTAEIEVFDTDVYVHLDEFELAIEIAMGSNQREIDHVQKHLSKDFEVWLVCKNQRIQEELIKKLEQKDSYCDQVTFLQCNQFTTADLKSLD